MNRPSTPEAESVLREWLRLDEPRLSEDVLDTALATTRAMPARSGRRARRRRTIEWLLIAAALGILAVSMLWVGTGMDRQRLSDVPEVAPLTEGSLAGVWYDVERGGAADGAWILRWSGLPSVEGPPTDGFVGRRHYRFLGDVRIDVGRLVIPGTADDDCHGIAASYRWTTVHARGTAEATRRLEAIDDPCPGRLADLAGTWRRVPADRSLADRFELPFLYASEERLQLWEATSRLHYFGGNGGVGQASGLGVWIVDEGFADPCAGTGTVAIPDGVDGLIDYLGSVPSIRILDTATAAADGRPGTRVRLTMDAGVCAAERVRIWRDDGIDLGTVQDHWFELRAGGRAELLATEIDGRRVVFVAWSSDGMDPMTSAYRGILEDLHFLANG